MDVSDRSLQVLLTQQAKILTTLLLFVRIFAFAGFVRGLHAPDFEKVRGISIFCSNFSKNGYVQCPSEYNCTGFEKKNKDW